MAVVKRHRDHGGLMRDYHGVYAASVGETSIETVLIWEDVREMI